MEATTIFEEIKLLVLEASGGMIELKTITYKDDLFDFGYTSISIVNLIELIEINYGLDLDVEKNITRLTTINNIYEVMCEKKSALANGNLL
jgi:acyl carrier protein